MAQNPKSRYESNYALVLLSHYALHKNDIQDIARRQQAQLQKLSRVICGSCVRSLLKLDSINEVRELKGNDPSGSILWVPSGKIEDVAKTFHDLADVLQEFDDSSDSLRHELLPNHEGTTPNRAQLLTTFKDHWPSDQLDKVIDFLEEFYTWLGNLQRALPGQLSAEKREIEMKAGKRLSWEERAKELKFQLGCPAFKKTRD